MGQLMDQIREAIRASGKTRYRISKDTGIDQAGLCRLMQGTHGLSVGASERLLDYLGMEIVVRPKRGRKDR